LPAGNLTEGQGDETGDSPAASELVMSEQVTTSMFDLGPKFTTVRAGFHSGRSAGGRRSGAGGHACRQAIKWFAWSEATSYGPVCRTSRRSRRPSRTCGTRGRPEHRPFPHRSKPDVGQQQPTPIHFQAMVWTRHGGHGRYGCSLLLLGGESGTTLMASEAHPPSWWKETGRSAPNRPPRFCRTDHGRGRRQGHRVARPEMVDPARPRGARRLFDCCLHRCLPRDPWSVGE